MKRKLIVSLVVVGLIVSSSPLHATCRVLRVRSVHHHHAAATKVVVPFAVPLAVPVAVAAPYFYGYSQFAEQRADGQQRVNETAAFSPLAARPSSLIATHCNACHSGTAPEGQLSLDRIERLSLADRLAAIRAVLSGRMPKGKPLDDAQLRGVVEELVGFE